MGVVFGNSGNKDAWNKNRSREIIRNPLEYIEKNYINTVDETEEEESLDEESLEGLKKAYKNISNSDYYGDLFFEDDEIAEENDDETVEENDDETVEENEDEVTRENGDIDFKDDQDKIIGEKNIDNGSSDLNDDSSGNGRLNISKKRGSLLKPEKHYKDQYKYYDYEQILNSRPYEKGELDEAIELCRKGLVHLKSINIGYYKSIGGNTKSIKLIGEYMINGYRKIAILMYDRENIIYTNCSCNTCMKNNAYNNYFHEYTFKKLCKYLLALFILGYEKTRNQSVGDITNQESKNFMKLFSKSRKFLEQDDNIIEEEVVLVPKIEVDRYVNVSFKVGTSQKQYVLKNINDLIKKYEEKGVLQLGKAFELDFSKQDFEDHSKWLFDIAEEYSDNLNTIETQYDVANTWESARPLQKIRLTGKDLDEFYDYYKDKTLDFKGVTNKNKVIHFGEEDIKIKFSIEPVMYSTIFDGVVMKGEIPSLYYGKEYTYIFNKEKCKLQRIDKELSDVLVQLSKTNKRRWTLSDYMIELKVGRSYLSDFYNNVLPNFPKEFEIEESQRGYIESFVAPNAEFSFYIDVDNEANEILCTAVVSYGDNSFKLYPANIIEASAYRNYEREDEIIDEILSVFRMFDNEKQVFYHENDADFTYYMLTTGLNQFMKLGDVHASEEFLKLRIKRRFSINVGVRVESELMTVEVLSDDIPQDELLDILKSYQLRKKFHKLKSGEILDLGSESAEELEALLDATHVSLKEFVKGKIQIPAYRALYLNKMLEEHDDIITHRDSNFKKLIKNFKTVKDSEYELPDSLENVARKYQKQGFRWLMTVKNCGFGGILADEMGLGKTLQTISVLLEAKKAGVLLNSLVVSPASLVYNWIEEFERFAPDISVKAITGTKAERRELIRYSDAYDVIVTSYDLLKRDIDLYEDKEFDFQIIDEAQYIKNPQTGAAKSVKVIKSKHRIALTGTPIENRLSELWSIFDYLMPGYLYNYEEFKENFESPIVKNQDEAASEKLKKMVSPFVLRRLKKDVLKDLPDKIQETRHTSFEKTQRELYDAQVTHMKQMLSEQSEAEYKKNKIQILSEIMRLRQICCDPEMFVDNYKGGSAKKEMLMELISDAIEGNHKMLIFSQFTTMLGLIEDELKKQKINYYKITGKTPKEERIKLVKAFNGDDTPVFLISLKAGGTGLNLVGADIVIHYDPWWNVAVENQATDRAHRIGQTNVVTEYKLIVKGTIEEKIIKMQETKKKLADEILKGENGNLASLSKDELLDLLS
ncbi:MAG: DEAD/DEAH box helicase [Lachnospiraceae bacterium]|nr:DEAD/DEAH box helicase [Lachnospiraceae bacterium]